MAATLASHNPYRIAFDNSSGPYLSGATVLSSGPRAAEISNHDFTRQRELQSYPLFYPVPYPAIGTVPSADNGYNPKDIEKALRLSILENREENDLNEAIRKSLLDSTNEVQIAHNIVSVPHGSTRLEENLIDLSDDGENLAPHEVDTIVRDLGFLTGPTFVSMVGTTGDIAPTSGSIVLPTGNAHDFQSTLASEESHTNVDATFDPLPNLAWMSIPENASDTFEVSPRPLPTSYGNHIFDRPVDDYARHIRRHFSSRLSRMQSRPPSYMSFYPRRGIGSIISLRNASNGTGPGRRVTGHTGATQRNTSQSRQGRRPGILLEPTGLGISGLDSTSPQSLRRPSSWQFGDDTTLLTTTYQPTFLVPIEETPAPGTSFYAQPTGSSASLIDVHGGVDLHAQPTGPSTSAFDTQLNASKRTKRRFRFKGLKDGLTSLFAGTTRGSTQRVGKKINKGKRFLRRHKVRSQLSSRSGDSSEDQVPAPYSFDPLSMSGMPPGDYSGDFSPPALYGGNSSYFYPLQNHAAPSGRHLHI